MYIDGLALMSQCVKFCDFKFDGFYEDMLQNVALGCAAPLVSGGVDPYN